MDGGKKVYREGKIKVLIGSRDNEVGRGIKQGLGKGGADPP